MTFLLWCRFNQIKNPINALVPPLAHKVPKFGTT
jgi:hypothetical protein